MALRPGIRELAQFIFLSWAGMPSWSCWPGAGTVSMHCGSGLTGLVIEMNTNRMKTEHIGRRVRLCPLLTFTLIWLLSCMSARGEDFFWLRTGGGNFHDADDWARQLIPTRRTSVPACRRGLPSAGS